MNKEALIDGLKEIARIVVLAIVAWLLTGGLEIILAAFNIGFEIKAQIIILLTLLLKGMDEWLHELGKARENESLTKGLTRF